ncbi:FISUMP domain-containing protein [Xanthomarina sp. F2636L]|uniref:FISUMP domain-containing protein n=1 Tax=Xanthomarina sp. F2636L TaxID=2996018 RepID=UPI00225E62D2|nr:FISUMP domain-containing protein [Xanthomarina sp. F2636L]MCX7552125.1 M43 family zinc metalloprotease [Xanthomarina sp. F2636L]
MKTYDFELKEDIYNIPIVFHIVHKNFKDGDISDEHFKNLVALVNERINFVDIKNIDSIFKNIVAKPNVNFYLPKVDENCNEIDNISWHYTHVEKYIMHLDDVFAFKRKESGYMDSKKFLNVWFVNFSNRTDNVGAYRSFNFQLDGIVVDFEQLNYVNFPFLLIHEIGHWLGLEHIWGNTPFYVEGNCWDDDGIKDTPNQKGPNIRTKTSGEFCDENSTTNHQNFMDYSYDVGMFTHGQKKAMRDYIYKKRRSILWKSNCNNNSELITGFIKDTRDNQSYKWVQIGQQKWMSENLNYATSGSKCYNEELTNCTIYGRLYNWEEAQTICPKGWRLPNYDDWKRLTLVVGNNQNLIRSEQGWLNDKNGTNKSGLNIIPSGYKSFYGRYYGLGKYSKLWLNNSNGIWAYSREIGEAYNYEKITSTGQNQKKDYLSCRCIQDNN